MTLIELLYLLAITIAVIIVALWFCHRQNKMVTGSHDYINKIIDITPKELDNDNRRTD